MPITRIHGFLVKPGKNLEETPAISGTQVTPKKGGKLYNVLHELYANAEAECDIDISFNHATSGAQKNDSRDLVLAYADSRHMAQGRALAEQLQKVTTNRSGLGLLFLLVGDEPPKVKKVVLSRFAAESAVRAELNGADLSVEFLEQVFMKDTGAYKAALYRGATPAEFWEGKVVDHQVGQAADYWIQGFLKSDLKTTSAAGTRRLAGALRKALAAAEDVSIKARLVAVAQLAEGIGGQLVSIPELLDRLGVGETGSELVKKQIKPHLINERFLLDAAELAKQLPLRSLELDNGGIMTAVTGEFEQIFVRSPAEDGRERFTTEGRVVDEKFRKKA